VAVGAHVGGTLSLLLAPTAVVRHPLARLQIRRPRGGLYQRGDGELMGARVLNLWMEIGATPWDIYRAFSSKT
jgi:hypothetical protein